jgi:hypothetical protein
VISGTVTGNTINTSDCFENVEIPSGSANFFDVKTLGTIDARTGQGTGTVSLHTPANNDCPGAGTTVLTGTIEIAPQGTDSDLDGCRDDQELRTNRGIGGLRDPFNRWDFMDVPTGTNLLRDRSVSGADISAVVARFGSNDATAGTFNRNSDPLVKPNNAVTPSGARRNYHPGYDRGGSIVGANAWNLRPSNGAIDGGDISAAVNQFGNNCLS